MRINIPYTAFTRNYRFVYLVVLILFFSSCEKDKALYREITFLKYLQPGVENAFAAHAISSNQYVLLGIDQTSEYEFGQLKALVIQIDNNTLKVDTTMVPDMDIAYPSNLVINDDKSTVFFALESNNNLSAFLISSDGSFDKKNVLSGFEGMAVISAARHNTGYWLLIQNQVINDYNTNVFIVSANDDFSNLTIVSSLDYNAEFIADIAGENLFNSYFLYHYLQQYSFIKSYNEQFYFNTPKGSGASFFSINTIGLIRLSGTVNDTIFIEDLLTIPNAFVKELEQTSSNIAYPVIYDYKNKTTDFYTFDISTEAYTLTSVNYEIDPDKKLMFVYNNTEVMHEKVALATKYNNKILVYSPASQTIDFSFGSTYESSIVAGFWGGEDSNQLIIFGNSLLYNQYKSNFIIIIPKESLLEDKNLLGLYDINSRF